MNRVTPRHAIIQKRKTQKVITKKWEYLINKWANELNKKFLN